MYKKLLLFSIFVLIFNGFILLQSGETADPLKQVRDLYVKYSIAVMSGSFNDAYGTLSSFTKKAVSYEVFVDANQKLEKYFRIKGSHLSKLRIRGSYGAATSVTYVDILQDNDPDKTLNGKIESQVFFIREGADWKIATGDDNNRKQFLQEHPKAKGLIEFKETKVYYKYKGHWVTFNVHYGGDKKDTLVVPE